jgi:membrane associated rhomboid family serine protease
MIPIQNAVPSRRLPAVTFLLIAANCLVFLYQLSLSPAELEWFLLSFAVIPARYVLDWSGDESLTLADCLPFITMMFLHGGWLHLIFNMWTLWLFGGTIEDRFGPSRYLAIYFACGIYAALAHTYFNPNSIVPAVGASGAIAGLLGCYTRLFPFARLIVVVPILFIPLFFEVPAIVFTGIWFLIQLLQGTAELFLPSAAHGVAWWAHIGGFVAGLLFGSMFALPRTRYRAYYADEGIYGFDRTGRR